MKALTTELKTIVKDSGSSLMELPGVGPIVAARVLADVGDVARFASWTGSAPIEASSGTGHPAPAVQGRRLCGTCPPAERRESASKAAEGIPPQRAVDAGLGRSNSSAGGDAAG